MISSLGYPSNNLYDFRMKIAVLIYGRIDHSDMYYRNIMNSISQEHTCDIFLSSDNPHKEDIDKFISTYKPKGYNTDHIASVHDIQKYSTGGQVCNKYNMPRHFFNKYRVFQLLQRYIEDNGVTYDIVIALRIDMKYQDKISFQTPRPNTIYVPAGDDFFGLNDRLAYGDMDSMGKYLNIYNTYTYILEHNLSICHPESLLFAHIKHSKLNVNRFIFRTDIIKY